MEPLVVLLIVLAIALMAGGLVIMPRGATSLGGRVLRSRRRLASVGAARAGLERLNAARTDPSPGPAQATRVEPIEVPAQPASRPLPPTYLSPRGEPAADGRIVERIGGVEERLDAIDRRLERITEAVREEMRLGRDTLGSAIASVEARQVTAVERLRSELAAQAGGVHGVPTPDIVRERRAEATLSLYTSIARFESALAQVTNPILLPGEAFAPPPEFLPESLSWENWKDVGERAFSLAEAFSTQRLCFTDATCQEISAFVTTMRGTLTRAIYPNLVPDPTQEQLDALRSALGSLANELPRARRALEGEFRTLSEASPPSGVGDRSG